MPYNLYPRDAMIYRFCEHSWSSLSLFLSLSLVSLYCAKRRFRAEFMREHAEGNEQRDKLFVCLHLDGSAGLSWYGKGLKPMKFLVRLIDGTKLFYIRIMFLFLWFGTFDDSQEHSPQQIKVAANEIFDYVTTYVNFYNIRIYFLTKNDIKFASINRNFSK